jgi:hypothetical protein
VRHEVVMCISMYGNKCNMQRLNIGFSKLKMDDWTHVNMLIVQEIWKNLLIRSIIIPKYLIACVLVYYNKCKMQLLSNGF